MVHAPAAELGGRAELGSEALFNRAGISAGRIIVATQRNIMGGFPGRVKPSQTRPARSLLAWPANRVPRRRTHDCGAETRAANLVRVKQVRHEAVGLVDHRSLLLRRCRQGHAAAASDRRAECRVRRGDTAVDVVKK